MRNAVAIATCLAVMTMFSGCKPENEPDSIVGVWVFENSAVTEVKVADGVPQETVNLIKDQIGYDFLSTED